MKTLNKISQANITPKQALELLKAGNARFVDNLRINRNLLQQMNETSDGQWPMAAIVSCMDSRTSAELIFDQGLGDIFSIRLAGAVISVYGWGAGNIGKGGEQFKIYFLCLDILNVEPLRAPVTMWS